MKNLQNGLEQRNYPLGFLFGEALDESEGDALGESEGEVEGKLEVEAVGNSEIRSVA